MGHDRRPCWAFLDHQDGHRDRSGEHQDHWGVHRDRSGVHQDLQDVIPGRLGAHLGHWAAKGHC